MAFTLLRSAKGNILGDMHARALELKLSIHLELPNSQTRIVFSVSWSLIKLREGVQPKNNVKLTYLRVL